MLLSASQVKFRYGISRMTLYRWERRGLLRALRTPGGKKRWRSEDIERLLGMEVEAREPRTVLYVRVSTKKQAAYLRDQRRRLEAYARARGWRYEVIEEIASGVNERRRGLRRLMNMARRGEVARVVVEYRDRLARFGFEYLRAFFESHGAEVVVLGGPETGDVQREMAEDLVAVVTLMAARIYGSRGGRSRARDGAGTD